MAISNVEIKARSSNHDFIRGYLSSHDAESKGTDHQIDTYFKVTHGRLKLREGNIENHLIHYIRSNQEGPKQSSITLYKSEPGSTLKEILTNSLGVIASVDKQREIYFIANVKFHIDTVKDLGTFMEIEAIDWDGSIGKEKLLKQCEKYMSELKVDSKDLLSVSYSDLVMEKQKAQA